MAININITFSYNKSTRCTNFWNLFLKWNATCFGQFLCPSSGVFHCTHSSGIWHLASRSICSCSQAVNKSVWHIPLLCVQWKTPDDGQRNFLKHVAFHSKNKFEKLVHLEEEEEILHDAWSHECQINITVFWNMLTCNLLPVNQPSWCQMWEDCNQNTQQ